MFGSKKSPQDRIRKSDKKIQKLRDKRSKLDTNSPDYEKKQWKINNKIHKQKVEIKIAEKELEQPVKKTTNVNNNFNYNKTEKGVHLHAHYHNGKKKK